MTSTDTIPRNPPDVALYLAAIHHRDWLTVAIDEAMWQVVHAGRDLDRIAEAYGNLPLESRRSASAVDELDRAKRAVCKTARELVDREQKLADFDHGRTPIEVGGERLSDGITADALAALGRTLDERRS